MQQKRGVLFAPRSRRAQITVFIIVGILLLFAFAGILLFTRTLSEQRLSAAGEPVITKAPPTFASLQQFSQNCLEQVGERGAQVLAAQGGYLYPELAGEFDASDPTQSQGVYAGSTKIPYWYYNQNPNEALELSFATHQPPLHTKDNPDLAEISVELQLERYISQELETCFSQFAPFSAQGMQIALEKQPTVDVVIAPRTINLHANLLIDARQGNEEYELRELYVKVPVALETLYARADEIRAMQEDFHILERQALDLLEIYSDTQADKLPPTNAVTFEAIPTVFWVEGEVQSDLKQVLASNVPLIQFEGTGNFHHYDYPVADLSNLYQRNYDNMILPLSDPQGLEVSTSYLNWEPYLFTGDHGGVIEPNHISLTNPYGFNTFGLNYNQQTYATIYDLSYPVLVSITDRAALNGRGLTFTFALEANVRKNDVPKDERPLPPANVALDQSDACDSQHRTTGLLRTLVVDEFSREPVEAVQIGLSIPEVDNCLIGQTNDDGIAKANYPAAYGAVSTYTHEEYLTNFYPIDTYQHRGSNALIGYAVADFSTPVVELIKKVDMPVEIELVPLTQTSSLFSSQRLSITNEQREEEQLDWYFTPKRTELTSDITALVTLTRINDPLREEFIVTVSSEQTQLALPLAPGEYEMQWTVVKQFPSNDPFIIPEHEICERIILRQECVTLEQTTFYELALGTGKTTITLEPQDVYGAQKLILPALVFDEQSIANPRIEDLQIVTDFEQIIPALPQGALEPRFE